MDDLAELRRTIRARRRATVGSRRQQISETTAATVLNWLSAQADIRHIATFRALAEEIDTAPLNTLLWQAGYCLYLPYAAAMRTPLLWLPYHPDTDLAPDATGIAAPLLLPPYNAPALDVVITPLVAWDGSGSRLGMGGGFYDRTFARKIPCAKPWLIGIAYPCQQVARLPRRDWDVTLDAVASAQNFYIYSQEQP